MLRPLATEGLCPTWMTHLTLAQNHLIELLPLPEQRRLLAVCEPVQLAWSDVLSERSAATRQVHFPVDGFVSLVAQIDGRSGLEVGMVGREGMVGVQLMLGVPQAPQRAVVQGPGAAWRAGAGAFQRALARSPALRRVLHRYLYVLMAQQATFATCLRYHQIGPRLARWLLMSHDRAHADHFHVTHEFLACTLGVRRVGITGAAGDLQQRGLIRYHRGELTVVDRPGLEAAACSCYAVDRQIYAERLGFTGTLAEPCVA